MPMKELKISIYKYLKLNLNMLWTFKMPFFFFFNANLHALPLRNPSLGEVDGILLIISFSRAGI